MNNFILTLGLILLFMDSHSQNIFSEKMNPTVHGSCFFESFHAEFHPTIKIANFVDQSAIPTDLEKVEVFVLSEGKEKYLLETAFYNQIGLLDSVWTSFGEYTNGDYYPIESIHFQYTPHSPYSITLIDTVRTTIYPLNPKSTIDRLVEKEKILYQYESGTEIGILKSILVTRKYLYPEKLKEKTEILVGQNGLFEDMVISNNSDVAYRLLFCYSYRD